MRAGWPVGMLVLVAACLASPDAQVEGVQHGGTAKRTELQSAWSVPNSSARSVAWGDWDGDGDLDLAVGNYAQPNRVYENVGGNLVQAWSASAFSYTASVAWGDWDNDGDLDLAVGNSQSQPNVVYQNDNGVLVPAWTSAEADTTHSVAWGDWDGDGDLDLAVGNANDQANRVYANTGGDLSLAWTSAETDYTRSVAWGDWDNDGDPDLAVGNWTGQANRVYRNTGGNLTLAWSSSETESTVSVAWGDLEGDGDLDLAVGNFAQPARIYLNSGGALAAGWASPILAAASVAWGDWNADGRLDLAIGTASGQPDRIYENIGGGALSLAWVSMESESAASLAWGDWDGDGDVDLAVGNSQDPTRVYSNEGIGLQLAWSTPQSANTAAVAWADWDGDGDPDLAVGNSSGQFNRIYRNDAGTFSLAWTSVESDSTNSLAWGDWDNDGDLDLAAGNSGANRVYTNNAGVLSLAWSSTEVDTTNSLAWGDWDNDGDLDLVAGNSGQANRVYQNNLGSLSLAWSATEINQTAGVAWGDWDNDGDLDLAVANRLAQPNRVYENTGGALSLVWTSLELDISNALAWGDWDADGDLDLAVGNDGPNRVYENLGGDLLLAWSSPDIGAAMSVEWGDCDGDGDLDLAAGNRNGQPNRLYRNGGGDLVLAWSSYEINTTSSVAWTDLDGDGDLDLATGNNAAQQTNVYKRHGRSRQGLTNNPSLGQIRALGTTRLTASPVTLPFVLSDAESDPVPSVAFEFSLAGGGQWRPATVTGATTNLATSPTGVPHTVTWDIAADLVQSHNVAVRMRVGQNPRKVAYPIQHPAFWTSSALTFRISTPVPDNDGDGLNVNADCNDAATSCTWNCQDADGDTYPDCLDRCLDVDGDEHGVNDGRVVGAGAVAVKDCTTDGATPCSLFDTQCIAADCDDDASTCTTSCAGDVDADGRVDCRDACIDVDADGYGGSLGGELCVTDGASGGSTGCALGPLCLGADCDDNAPTCIFDCVSDYDGNLIADCMETCASDADGDDLCDVNDCNAAASSCTTDCTDSDGDGAPDCLDLCLDTDGDDHGQDGARVVGLGGIPVIDCTTDGVVPCVLSDTTCLASDCDDAASTCTTNCLSDSDNDGLADCVDRCVDVDKDGLGLAGAGLGCVTDGATGGSTPCPGGGPTCAATDCDDGASSCTTACLDGDADLIVDCVDRCYDVDHDDHGAGDGRVVGGGFIPVGACTTDGATPCALAEPACTGADCNDGLAACTSDCVTDVDGNNIPDCADTCATSRLPGCLHLEKLSGDGQSGLILQPLALPLRVRALSIAGVPLTGESVAWSASGDGGVSALGVTDGDGISEVVATLGSTVGVDTQTFTATLGDGTATLFTASAFAQSGTGTATAVATVTPTSGSAPLAVVLDGGASSGGDGQPVVFYNWSTGDGSYLRLRTTPTDYVFTEPGGYVVELEVVDAAGASGKHSVDVRAADALGRVPPRARIISTVVDSSRLNVLFTCDCTPGDAAIATHYWEFGDGEVTDLPAKEHAYVLPGSYRAHLTVEDNNGLRASHSINVVVGDVESPPSARIVAAPLQGDAPLTVSLEGLAQDRFGSVDRYQWTIADEAPVEGRLAEHVFAAPGYYPVSLQVTDNSGLHGFDQVTVTVLANGLRVPRIISQPGTTAVEGEPYAYDADNVASAQGVRPLLWDVGRDVGGSRTNAPDGFDVDGLTGEIIWTPAADQVGEQRVSLVALNAVGVAVQDFVVTVAPAGESPTRRARPKGCNTSSTVVPLLLSLTLLFAGPARARRRAQRGSP